MVLVIAQIKRRAEGPPTYLRGRVVEKCGGRVCKRGTPSLSGL